MISSLTVVPPSRLGDRTDTVTDPKKVLAPTTFIMWQVESGPSNGTEVLESLRGEHVFSSDIAGLPDYFRSLLALERRFRLGEDGESID
jgi:hypothetical protein